MSGIYIHIPFCKQACSYCNFHFSTNLQNKDALLNAIHEELRQRQEYLNSAEVSSVYFGGGTPSLLSTQELNQIIDIVTTLYPVTPDAEVTLEANPDDLTEDSVKALRDSMVNRLSIGIQSFYDDELKIMRRAHTAAEGLSALERVIKADFRSFTIDLIYGTPFLTQARWHESLKRVASMGIPHLSAYQLTIEPKTILAHQIRQNQMTAPDDAATVEQFEALMDWAERSGYEHYEISNLAKAGHRAVHNSNYWKGVPYLGIGPSAHSFNGIEREWNIANNARYVKGITTGSAREGVEMLSQQDHYNEFVMTGLRTMEGVSEERLLKFGEDCFANFREAAQEFITSGEMIFSGGSWTLSKKGRFFADRIASSLFMVH